MQVERKIFVAYGWVKCRMLPFSSEQSNHNMTAKILNNRKGYAFNSISAKRWVCARLGSW
jgi:hypothetical protein